MYKWFNILLVFLLLPVFLISATGLSISKRSCQMCGVVDYSLIDNNSCCQMAEPEPVATEDISCCAQPVTACVPMGETCCESEVFFLKNEDDKYVQNERISFTLPFTLLPGHQSDSSLFLKDSEKLFIWVDVFKKQTGKHLLIFISQLKLDCLS